MKTEEYNVVIKEWLPETIGCMLAHLCDDLKQPFHFWDDFLNYLKTDNRKDMDNLIHSTRLKISNRNKNELIIISNSFDLQVKIGSHLELIIFDKIDRFDLIFKMYCELYLMFPTDENLNKLEEAILFYRLKGAS